MLRAFPHHAFGRQRNAHAVHVERRARQRVSGSVEEVRRPCKLDRSARTTMQQADGMDGAVGRMDARQREPMVARDLPGHVAHCVVCHQKWIPINLARVGNLLGSRTSRPHFDLPALTSPTRWALAATVCLLGAARIAPVLAQGARGAGPDARTVPAGTLRMGVGVLWDRNAEISHDGRLLELGARYTLDALGSATIPQLAAGEATARAAAAMPTLTASLGASAVHARRATEVTPVFAEFGVTSRLTLGVVVPFVTAATRVDATVNGPGGIPANFGLNPTLASATLAAANDALVGQLTTASTYVAQQMTACAATPGAPGCGPYLASPSTAQQLVSASRQFAAALATLYGTTNQTGLPFVPRAGSTVQSAVAARLAGLKAAFTSFGAPPVAAGAPAGAPAPITGSQFQEILTGSAYGIASTGLIPVTRRGVGNVEVTAQYTLHDAHATQAAGAAASGAPWWRAAVGAAYVLGAGRRSATADLLPVDVGDPASAMVARGVAEVGLGRYFALAAETAVTVRSPISTIVRVPRSAVDVFPLPDQDVPLHYTPGTQVLTTLAPRWTPNDALAVAALYEYRSMAAARYTVDGAFNVTPSTPDMAILSRDSAEREHRFGFSVAYSTVHAFDAGRARWPIEIALTHFQTTSASGGAVPKLARDDVTLRWYWRPFGRRSR